MIALSLFLLVGCATTSEHHPNLEKGKQMVLKSMQKQYPQDGIIMDHLVKISYPEQNRSRTWGATFIHNENRYLITLTRQGKVIEYFKAPLKKK